jgi:tRNA(adenine34) deaminase
MVPDHPGADGAQISREAQRYWQACWSGRTLMAVGVRDPVMGTAQIGHLQEAFNGCSPPVLLESAGHFVPEWGGPLAYSANTFFT